MKGGIGSVEINCNRYYIRVKKTGQPVAHINLKISEITKSPQHVLRTHGTITGRKFPTRN
jgi:hypothetical protein